MIKKLAHNKKIQKWCLNFASDKICELLLKKLKKTNFTQKPSRPALAYKSRITLGQAAE